MMMIPFGFPFVSFLGGKMDRVKRMESNGIYYISCADTNIHIDIMCR